jgi:hypothetical protein
LGRASLQRRIGDPAALRSVAAQALIDYVNAFLDAQELRGSDAVMLPYHLARGAGTASRDGELRLAEAGVAGAQLWIPPCTSPADPLAPRASGAWRCRRGRLSRPSVGSGRFAGEHKRSIPFRVSNETGWATSASCW